jgi:hypothetical protein
MGAQRLGSQKSSEPQRIMAILQRDIYIFLGAKGLWDMTYLPDECAKGALTLFSLPSIIEAPIHSGVFS